MWDAGIVNSTWLIDSSYVDLISSRSLVLFDIRSSALSPACSLVDFREMALANSLILRYTDGTEVSAYAGSAAYSVSHESILGISIRYPRRSAVMFMGQKDRQQRPP